MVITRESYNRRLYLRGGGRYITLRDVKRFVLDGEQFQVLDSKSKVDITNKTLKQILAASNVPSEKLKDLIKEYA